MPSDMKWHGIGVFISRWGLKSGRKEMIWAIPKYLKDGTLLQEIKNLVHNNRVMTSENKMINILQWSLNIINCTVIPCKHVLNCSIRRGCLRCTLL